MNYEQATIDFTARKENNHESQSFLKANKPQINRCCTKVLELLLEGKRLTVLGAAKDYNISYLPRRIKDLKDFAGVEIKDEMIQGTESKYKEYFL